MEQEKQEFSRFMPYTSFQRAASCYMGKASVSRCFDEECTTLNGLGWDMQRRDLEEGVIGKEAMHTHVVW